MSNNEEHDNPPGPQNLAAGLEIPVMAPRGASQRPQPRAAPTERRVPVRRAVEGQRPVQGLGEPQPLDHTTILNQAHGLVERYKRNPEEVDEKFVQVMMLEALAAYGSQAAKVQQLTQEVGRLRKTLERVIEDDDDDAPRSGRGRTRLDRLRDKAAKGRPNGRRRGGLRGRAAR